MFIIFLQFLANYDQQLKKKQCNLFYDFMTVSKLSIL